NKMTASDQIAACGCHRAQRRLSAAFCVIAQSLHTFRNSHTSPLPSGTHVAYSIAKGKAQRRPGRVPVQGFQGPLSTGGAVRLHQAEPESLWKSGFARPTSRYFSKLQEQGVWESVAQRRELPNLTQEKTQRVFKGEGSGTRFVGLRATKQ